MYPLALLKRLRKEIYLDDDEILGDDKESILCSISLMIKLYRKYEVANSYGSIKERVVRMFKKNLPFQLKDEAGDILVDLIVEDCRNEGYQPSQLQSFTKGYLLSLLENYDVDKRNAEIVEIALEERRYVEKNIKLRKRSEKDLTEEELDWLDEELLI